VILSVKLFKHATAHIASNNTLCMTTGIMVQHRAIAYENPPTKPLRLGSVLERLGVYTFLEGGRDDGEQHATHSLLQVVLLLQQANLT